jgi:hypothetical protein
MTRLLKRKDAAAYCGLSIRLFNAWVAKQLLPPSIRNNQWDRKAIDLYLDRLSGLDSSEVSSEADPFLPIPTKSPRCSDLMAPGIPT